MIQKNHLTPNIFTFGSMAYLVKDIKSLKEFLQNLEVRFLLRVKKC